MGDAAKKEAAFYLNPLGYRHPIVAAYQGETEPVTSGLTQAITFQYHKLVLPPNSAAEIALNSTPAIRPSSSQSGTRGP